MKNYVFLVIGMFTMGCNAFMITGLLPQIGHTIGQSIGVTGQGITVFSLTYLISSLLFSIIFSNTSVKFIIQIALTVFLLGTLITFESKTIMLFLIGRSLAGIGAGIFTPLCVTAAIHFSDPSTKGRVLSLIWGANSAGAVFGVPFGLYLSAWLHWRLSIAYIAILGLLSLIGLSFQKTAVKLPVSTGLGERFHLLTDLKVMFVIGVTCFTSMTSLGLYSYVSSIQSGAPNSLTMTVFIWGLGGFIGSSVVGFLIDMTEKPQLVMSCVLLGLIAAFIAVTLTENLPTLGLFSFFIWGAFGWATMTPQQHILFQLHERHGAILVALNASAIGLGSALGTAIFGILLAYGFKAIKLPLLAATILLVVFIVQIFNKEYSK